MTLRNALREVTLEDKYDLTKTEVFVTGYQAIVRMCLMQKARDRRAGLDTAGYVTGYRGSPLGGLDQQFARAEALCRSNDILCRPAINEDLASTALWGAQQAELRGEGKFDGVFGMLYAKGPGFDRAGDVLRHANCAGTSRHGGVLALMGDDHTAESSTTAHQSEFNLVNYTIPILNRLGNVALFGRLGRGQMPARRGRVDRGDRRLGRPGEDRAADRSLRSRRPAVPHAGGRAQHPSA